MFENYESGKPELSIKASVIAIACGAGGMLLSFGLCGLAGSFSGAKLSFFAPIGFAIFLLSLVTILIGFAWFAIVMIANAFRN